MADLSQSFALLYKELIRLNGLKAQIIDEEEKLREEFISAEAEIKVNYVQKCADLDEDIAFAKGFVDSARPYTLCRLEEFLPKEPNFQRMQTMKLAINDRSSNDPTATTLFIDANSAVVYLQNKRNVLIGQRDAEISQAQALIKGKIQQLRQNKMAAWENEYASFIHGKELSTFAAQIREHTDKFYILPKFTYSDIPVPSQNSQYLRFGVMSKPFPVEEKFRSAVAQLFKQYFDPFSSNLRLPFGIYSNLSEKFRIRYPDSQQDNYRKIFCSVLFNILRNVKPIPNRVFFLDAVTRNTDELGLMRLFIGNPGFIRFSADEKEDMALLDQLVQLNAGQNEVRFLFVRGYPDYYSSQVREKIRNICANYRNYKITVFLVESRQDKGMQNSKEEAALSGAFLIQNNGDATYVYPSADSGQKGAHFSWFGAPASMTKDLAEVFKMAYIPTKANNSLIDVCPLSSEVPYKRGMRPKEIRIPFGLDELDSVCSFVLDDVNPFAFLMGASGSGKSSFLHILITNVVRNYHPDEVELWLADFNKVGFMPYKTDAGMPPHIRYLLLDNTPLYIYSFIDKMTQEYNRRQNEFARHGWDNIKDIPSDFYMPYLLIILDEFDVMSTAIREDDTYKNKLQQLVTKGRKFGFRIIFSTQSFTNGASGLTEAARQSISARLAMYSPNKEEIKQTISVPLINEKLAQTINNVTPYHILYRMADIQTGFRIEYVGNFFVDNPQLSQVWGWMSSLKQLMHPVKAIAENDASAYVGKAQVCIDGMNRVEFSSQEALFRRVIQAREQQFSSMEGDILLFPGKPYSLDAVHPIVLRKDEDENILIFCSAKDDYPLWLTEVVAAVKRSSQLNGVKCELWTTSNDVCYRKKQNYWKSMACYDQAASIVARIGELRARADSGSQEQTIVFILNFPKVFGQLSHSQSLKQGDPASGASSLGLGINSPFKVSSDPLSYILNNSSGSTQSKSGNVENDLKYLLRWGPQQGIHFVICSESNARLKTAGFQESSFPHVIAFTMDGSDADGILDKYARRAKLLPGENFLYTDRQEIYNYTLYANNDI